MTGEPAGGDFQARVRLSPLFAVDYYKRGAEARGAPVGAADPVRHYFERGEGLRIAPHPLFDPDHYARNNPDVVAAGLNLLWHYLENGHREGRDPHPLVDLKLLRSQLAPDFRGDPLIAYLQSRGGELKPHRLIDPAFIAAEKKRLQRRDERPALLFYLDSDPLEVNPSAEFDGLGYQRLYPETAPLHPLLHYARYGDALALRAPRARGPVAHVAPLIEAAAALDPDIVKPFADIAATPFMHGYDLARREFRLWRLLAKAAGRRPHQHVIMTPWLKRGGADRAALHLARGLLERDPQARVLIVCTQEDAVEALDWGPASQRLSVARIAREVDDAHDTFVAFCNFLRFCRCRHLYVINSHFGWELIVKYGPTLKRLMRLYGFAFCQDYDSLGRRAGYAWTHLARAFDALDVVVSDNSRTAAEFADDHGFSREDLAKFFTLPLPVDERLFDLAAQSAPANRAAQATRRAKIFWAGRFSAQKTLDVAALVARALPEVDICAFGGDEAPAGAPDNLIIGGPFDDFADLPLHEASAFLHTARWEGLPNVLLEAGAAGLPIVARDVGGVGDLVDPTTGWPVAAGAGAGTFADALRDLLARPREAEARTARMRARIVDNHSPAAFAQGVEKLLAFGGAA